MKDYYTEDANTESITCALTGRTILSPTEKSKEDLLFDPKNQLNLTTLGPLFNQFKDSVFQGKNDLEIEFTADSILDHHIVLKDKEKDLHELVLLTKTNGSLQLVIFHIKLKNWSNKHLSFSQ